MLKHALDKADTIKEFNFYLRLSTYHGLFGTIEKANIKFLKTLWLFYRAILESPLYQKKTNPSRLNVKYFKICFLAK